MTSALVTARRGTTLIITINRPQARNAVDLAVARGIADALDTLDRDPQLHAAVLTGVGDVFCAGMDLKAFTRGEVPFVGDRGFAGIAMRSADKPVIAAVTGSALAGGFEVALACDLIVAGRDCSFGIPEVKRGLVAAGGALLRLPRRLPYHLAMQLALTGETISAQRLFDLGLVNELVDTAEVLDRALVLASTITDNAPLAVRATKAIVRQSLYWSEPQGWEQQSRIAGPVFGSADAQEGARAFAERRRPHWQGR